MTWDADPEPAGDPLLVAVTDAGAAVDRATRSVTWQRTDATVLDAVRRVAELRARLDGLHLALVREVDARGTAQASPVATTVEGFLRTATLVGPAQARRDVAAARATAPGQPLEPFGAALLEGRGSRAHLDVAVRCLDRVPGHLLERPGATRTVVDFLTDAARDATPLDTDRAAKQLLAHLDPDGSERFDEDAHSRRFLDLHVDSTGMVVGRFQLDATAGATLRAALDTRSAPVPGADGTPDRRQARERRADALVALADAALAVTAPVRGERPRVVVHVTPEQLRGAAAGLATVEGSGPVSTSTARRLSCDAVLQRVVMDPSAGPLDVGRRHRLVTLPQRRALEARDGGCVIPGCGAPARTCDAHHVVFWADGGPTDLDNLCLVCPAHHTAVHAGTWQVLVEEGRFLVVPPRWVDPLRRPGPVRHHSLRMTLADLDVPGQPGEPGEPGASSAATGTDVLPEPEKPPEGPAPPPARPPVHPYSDLLIRRDQPRCSFDLSPRQPTMPRPPGPQVDLSVSPFMHLMQARLREHVSGPP